MNWRQFVTSLATEVDWRDGDYLGSQAGTVERILREAAAQPDLLRERTEEIVADDALYRSLSPYFAYPRVLMDKFVLHVDPEDRFRVRMHRFWPRKWSGNATEKVHYHKWNMSTVILSGSYRERRFDVLDLDEENRRAEVRVSHEQTFAAGMTNSLAYRKPHQVIMDSEFDPCITLFVRGPSLQPTARIFDTERGTFYDTSSPDPQNKEGLLHMGRLEGIFHPFLPGAEPATPRHR
ncbi:hypothetical protein [Streptomyces sp. NPDC021020]|uniref:hypothetical protein n=1 Tax=Streptomyces sp. NPDC021020 TaxID=3365109 RepID=UPI003788015A